VFIKMRRGQLYTFILYGVLDHSISYVSQNAQIYRMIKPIFLLIF
jgi:hypothetical protein